MNNQIFQLSRIKNPYICDLYHGKICTNRSSVLRFIRQETEWFRNSASDTSPATSPVPDISTDIICVRESVALLDPRLSCHVSLGVNCHPQHAIATCPLSRHETGHTLFHHYCLQISADRPSTVRRKLLSIVRSLSASLPLRSREACSR